MTNNNGRNKRSKKFTKKTKKKKERRYRSKGQLDRVIAAYKKERDSLESLS